MTGSKPAIAQLVEHLTVEFCSNQMVPGSIPGGRIHCGVRVISLSRVARLVLVLVMTKGSTRFWADEQWEISP